METQGDFVQSLATEVRAASFTDIEDLLAFVSWLDEELSFLVNNSSIQYYFRTATSILFTHGSFAVFLIRLMKGQFLNTLTGQKVKLMRYEKQLLNIKIS